MLTDALNDEDTMVKEAPAVVQPLPFGFARRHGILLTAQQPQQVTLTCRDSITATTLAEIRRHFGVALKLNFISDAEFETLLQRQYEQGSNGALNIMEDIEGNDLFSIAQDLPEPEDLMEDEDDAPIIRLINALLAAAIKENASDIHIEPFENRLVVRMRVDGVLREILEPKRVLAPLLVSRIKVMAKLDIAEKRLPQDGRISLRIAGRAVDVRVSTLPAGGGERVVMRLLDKQAGRLDLEHLGMPPQTLKLINEVIHRPHGIVLTTGPTGSGKTTSLYAMLTRLNNQQRNIMTVEDPIEYYIDGISQTHVNTKVDLTFVRGLRAILRQDPDIVMVGEIRDLETARIAVQASLTGHMVLSTLHTNTAVGAVTRLRDMGVEPFLLSSSLNAVLAQRLVRVLCPECKRPHVAQASDCDVLGVVTDQAPTLYEPVGCSSCNGIGYRGRIGLYELIVIDETLRGMIHDGASEQEMEQQARQHTNGIREEGRRLVLSGSTSLEEVLRVTRED
ncbi:type II secretion system ATPase GspE [Sulfuriflexus sp.]|uniref:type II secretion system ATPase GspE n=1 Tax=Sulfuriflexus sp. TaxID=2015443 RepID=UPI0028CC5B8D|nr:type II secretion system ATPase GspE [Sulfuriflexus sp.]MDT8403948.1 type II secretion system ATPase GspE [Sulfuriflexus sp.]